MSNARRIGALIASVAILFCSNAWAGSMSATPISIDKASSPAVITLPDMVVTLGNNLTYQDDIFIDIDGASPDVSTGLPFGAVNCDGPGHGTAVVGYVQIGTNRWHFRVTSIDGLSYGEHCTFSGLKISKSSIGAVCSIGASYEASHFITGQRIDSAGPIVVANVTPCGPPPPEVIEVGIDIKPGSAPNTVNPKSKGSIPVAILSSSKFYAPGDTVTSSLTFVAPGQTSMSLQRCNPAGEDVNADGYVDLVCHFSTQLAGFKPGDTLGVVIGTATNGAFIVGWDTIRIVPQP
jgi:hypothetical protein